MSIGSRKIQIYFFDLKPIWPSSSKDNQRRIYPHSEILENGIGFHFRSEQPKRKRRRSREGADRESGAFT